MPDWIAINGEEIVKILISTVLIFLVLIVVVRLSGLRSFAKITAIDFASTIAIGSILASTLLSGQTSVLKGAVGIVCVLLFQTIFSKLLLNSNLFKAMVTNSPMYLMKGERIIHENLKKANFTEDQLMAKLREANVLQLSKVKYVVLETTGDVSVLHSKDEIKVDDKILAGVEETK